MEIKVKYFDGAKKIEKIEKGDWIDLYANKTVFVPYMGQVMIPLGVAMELPKGYEAHIIPRSSLFKNYGVIQTNHFGLIDNSYCGDNDQWHFPVQCTSPRTHVKMDCLINNKENHHLNEVLMGGTWIMKGDKICQFRIQKSMENVELVEVESLDNKDRGGFGSTGTK